MVYKLIPQIFVAFRRYPVLRAQLMAVVLALVPLRERRFNPQRRTHQGKAACPLPKKTNCQAASGRIQHRFVQNALGVKLA